MAGAGGAGFLDGPALSARFDGPSGLALDAAGNLIIADTNNDVIRRLGADGTVVTLAGTPGVAALQDGVGDGARFDHPTAVAVDPLGNIYVADTGNHAVRRIAPSGLVTTAIRSGLDAPSGLAFDTAGRLLISDRGLHAVFAATPAPRSTLPPPPPPARRRAVSH